MAQKKKKGPPPRSKEKKGRRVSASQVAFAVIGVLVALSMIIGMLRF